MREFELSHGEATTIGRKDVVYKAKIHRRDLKVSRRAAVLTRHDDTVILSVLAGMAPVTIRHGGDVISVAANEESAIDCPSEISIRGYADSIWIYYSFGDGKSVFHADTEAEEEAEELDKESNAPLPDVPPLAESLLAETQPEDDATQPDM